MKIFIVNSAIQSEAKNFLKKYGRMITVQPNKNLPKPEQCHADMQFAKICQNTLVAAPEVSEETLNLLISCGIHVIKGITELSSAYPQNIPYNILNCGKHFFHNTKHTDPAVVTALSHKNAILHNVRQGYAGCSSIAVSCSQNKTLVLSSDPGIISAIQSLQEPTLTAEFFEATNEILLEGYDHGFIGGCCGFDQELGLLLYGKINGQLAMLSEKYNFTITSIYDGPITDVGGILVMYPNLQDQD